MSDEQRQSGESIEVSQSGIKLPIKAIVAALAIVLGGGGTGFTLWDSATESKLAAQVEEFKQIEDKRHEETQSTLEEHGKLIESLSQSVSDMSKRQLRAEAREEAHRVTESIEDRSKREREFGRLFEKNIDRLSEGRDPCADVHCGN